MPFNIGGGEAIFILALVLIVFGAGRLPEILGQLGKGIRSFQDAASGKESATALQRRCPSCDGALPERAKFCPACGRPL